MDFYDSRTVAAHFGINHRILMNWVKTGLVHPHDHHDHTGRRKSVLFSAGDVKEIARLVGVYTEYVSEPVISNASVK